MLYIIRHGKTDWNDRHKLQGRTGDRGDPAAGPGCPDPV